MKKALLIAGGGTLGAYTKDELLKLDHKVDVICLENYVSDNENLTFYMQNATLEYLTEFLKDKYYDGIVNFIHYTDTEEYKKVHTLLCKKTDQLVFLSSYRVYGNLQSPITEDAPQLYDIIKDEEFLNTEDYAVPKTKNERYIMEESNTSNWTIVRPVISFSKRRLDVVTTPAREVVERAKRNEEITVPRDAKNLTAGLDWAGNSGKLIAHLLFNEKALGEAFTVSTAQNLTWGEIADYYTELIGAKFKWVSTEDYYECNTWIKEHPYIFIYDRLYDRKIDNTKILKATGLTKDDFTSIKEGIKIELENIAKEG